MTSFSRLLPLVALAVLPAWNAFAPPFTVASGSSVRVSGTSNVHDWACSATRVTGSMQGEVTGGALTGVSAMSVTVPVAALDCRNGTMNGNLRRALNASANPNIRFALSGATVAPAAGGKVTVSGNGQLTVNGQTKPVRISATGEAKTGGSFRFTGSLPVVMSEFGVTPPVAMMGAMRTGDRVTVAYDIVIQP